MKGKNWILAYINLNNKVYREGLQAKNGYVTYPGEKKDLWDDQNIISVTLDNRSLRHEAWKIDAYFKDFQLNLVQDSQWMKFFYNEWKKGALSMKPGCQTRGFSKKFSRRGSMIEVWPWSVLYQRLRKQISKTQIFMLWTIIGLVVAPSRQSGTLLKFSEAKRRLSVHSLRWQTPLPALRGWKYLLNYFPINDCFCMLSWIECIRLLESELYYYFEEDRLHVYWFKIQTKSDIVRRSNWNILSIYSPNNEWKSPKRLGALREKLGII